jgi:hypothetical protein
MKMSRALRPIAMCFLAGCAVGSDSKRCGPPVSSGVSFARHYTESSRITLADDTEFWKRFSEQILSSPVNDASSANYDLNTALEVDGLGQRVGTASIPA